jgi:hypothetical protein
LESHDTTAALDDPDAALQFCETDMDAFSGELRQEYFACECHSDEHIFKFSIDPDDGDFVLSMHMNDYRNWFGRFWEAVKYVFGHKSKYGHWDVVQLDLRAVERLHRLTNEAIDFKIAARDK